MQVERVMTDLGGTDFGDDEAAMERYRAEGTARAKLLYLCNSFYQCCNSLFAAAIAPQYAYGL